MEKGIIKFLRLIIPIVILSFQGCGKDDSPEPLKLEGNIFFENEEVVAYRNSSDPLEVTINFAGPLRDRDVKVSYQITFPSFNPAISGEDFVPQNIQEIIIPKNRASVSLPLVQSILKNDKALEDRFFNIELKEAEGLTLGEPETGQKSSLSVAIKPFSEPINPNDPNGFLGDKRYAVTLNGDDYVIPYFSNVDDVTDTSNPDIKNAIVAVHGSGKNASRIFWGMQEAASIEGVSMENYLIIAPQYLEEEDIDDFNLDPQHLYWTGNWRSGHRSLDRSSNPRPEVISSFAVMDSLITKLLEYPNLERIVLTGFSAGGQFANRYSISTPVADNVEANGVSITFIPNNPASYTYMDDRRLVVGTEDTFETPKDLQGCFEFNEFKYGLEDLPQYLDDIGEDVIRQRFPKRHVVYLIGLNDNNPNFPGFDRSCEALYLGRHRLERAINYFNYLKFYYNDVFGIDITATQSIDFVPRTGHSSSGMFTSEVGRSYLFE